jgi:hypothetical protein
VRKRNAVAAVAALGGVLFAASAFSGACADAATPAPTPPPACTPVYFDVTLGQGIDVFCEQVQGPYQVIAQCDDGVAFWSVMGTVTTPNSGPTVAICNGDLLAAAHVVSYYITQDIIPGSRH